MLSALLVVLVDEIGHDESRRQDDKVMSLKFHCNSLSVLLRRLPPLGRVIHRLQCR